MYKIIILDDMPYIRYRVKQLLSNDNIEVYETATSFDFFNKLYDKKGEINLIILEVGLNTEDGFDVLKKVNEKNLKIPIMILTKMNTRTDFIRCIKEGTDEYILKPYDEKEFLKRIVKLIKSNDKNKEAHKSKKATDKPEKVIYLNFQEYLVQQIEQAREKNTKVSVMMISFIKKDSTLQSEKIEAKEKYLILTNLLYEKLKHLFKVPDLFEKYGLSNFVGIIPWEKDNPTDNIEKNIQKEYVKISENDIRYKDYEVECIFVTYPEHGKDKKELMDKLTIEMKEKINENTN